MSSFRRRLMMTNVNKNIEFIVEMPKRDEEVFDSYPQVLDTIIVIKTNIGVENIRGTSYENAKEIPLQNFIYFGSTNDYNNLKIEQSASILTNSTKNFYITTSLEDNNKEIIEVPIHFIL